MKELFLTYWSFFSDKLIELSSYYGVDPLIFGLLYAGTIPFLWFSVIWTIRNLKRKKPVMIPATIAVLCVTGTYIYLFLVGQNLPYWLYGVAIGMVGFSGYNIHKKVMQGSEFDN